MSFALCLALTACGDDDESPSTFDAGPRRDAGTRDGAVFDGAADGATDGATDGGAPLAESGAVHVLTTINAGEIELATLALARATDPETRSFANRMITEHTAVQSMIDAWASENGTNPSDNEVSTMLEQETMATRVMLETLPAGAFDPAYLESQVTMHQDALLIIDRRLVPGTQDQAFLELLTGIRRDIADHLARAIVLRDGLSD